MAGVYTVSRVNHYISGLFDGDYALSGIQVQGEVSNCKYHSSGHIYFTLKDEKSTLSAVMFAGDREGLGFRLQDGQRVIASGQIRVFERNGAYQLYAKQIRMDGAGEGYQQFDQLKRQLAEMGMFDDIYKQPIPKYIHTLGVVTAPTGAAVRDMIQIAQRRNPYIQILLFPALVQGEGAAESICRGIHALEGKADCIIVGRGGGSMEDLWAFNELEVARAIFDCETPIISAVGHETDVTIADFVADLRAPTPSAAAELAVYDVALLKEELEDHRQQMFRIMGYRTEAYRHRVREAESRLRIVHPETRIFQERQYLADLQLRLEQRMQEQLRERRHRLEVLTGRLDGASPLKRLSGGYSYVENMDGCLVKSVGQVEKNQILRILVTDGEIEAAVCDIKEKS